MGFHLLHLVICICEAADSATPPNLDGRNDAPLLPTEVPDKTADGFRRYCGTVCYFMGFLRMRKPSSNKRPTARVRRPSAKTLAASNDPVKRGARQRSPQADSSLVGALFNSQVAVARLMYQFSPLQMITRQQAIILDTFTSALNGALEAPERGSKKDT
jgi:hypothetical protein